MLSYIVSGKEPCGTAMIYEHEKDYYRQKLVEAKTWNDQPPSSIQVVTQQLWIMMSGMKME